MGKASKRLKRDPSESEEEFGSHDSDMDTAAAMEFDSEEEFDSEDDPSASGDDNNEKSEDEEEEEEEDEDDESDQEQNRDAEMEQLEKEYLNLRNEEQNLLTNLKRHKDEDVLKGQAVKNQKALWDRTLELRFLLQKAFSSSNKLPKDPVRSEFCSSNEAVDKAYADIISSSQGVLSSMLDLQEALLEKNPSIVQTSDGNNKESGKHDVISNGLNEETDDDWLRLQHMHLRLAPFRNNAVDKWQRKTLVNTGAAVLKGKLHAFNQQNISDQVAGYMRDPSRMIKRMQLRRPSVGIIGEVLFCLNISHDDNVNEDGDPELLDDSEFYQQLLKEFLESCNLGSSESMFYAMRRMQPKKRKVVDRRASKSRKIRYQVHEKIVNFMAPLPMTVPPMAPKLFENLFGRGNQ
ncbi:protein AATF isoform X1 [Carex littledalei]|uniref:Protein AATF isoform X1 n=1 Tax=Carex littledalei TaxID=544730 RepID=A0A833RN91_9POAL|nr:protein AATF isoform X1 [Carex littledalei]